MTRDIYQEADDLERAGRLDEAGERWREAVERTDNSAARAHQPGRGLLALQAKDEARQYLERATTADPSDSEAWSNLAATYVEDDRLWRCGEFQAAETHLRLGRQRSKRVDDSEA